MPLILERFSRPMNERREGQPQALESLAIQPQGQLRVRPDQDKPVGYKVVELGGVITVEGEPRSSADTDHGRRQGKAPIEGGS
jgi:hypothetical protein